MSVWPNPQYPAPALAGAEGELVSITISVEPRLLEALLEALSRLDFPMNPQIYHQAAAVYVGGDGAKAVGPATLVEFPAYTGRLAGIREALRAAGFEAGALRCRSMLDEIRGGVERARTTLTETH
ncbi:MAG: hypothetical protein AAB225_16085 [Acidobacteriota bacterium]